MKNSKTSLEFDTKADYATHSSLAFNLKHNLDDQGMRVHDGRFGMGKKATKNQNKHNKRALNEHMSSIKKVYKIGSVALETAHSEALVEAGDRTYQQEVDLQLNDMFDELSDSLIEEQSAAEYESMSVLDKLIFIRNFALNPENKSVLPHIQVDENNAVLINANCLMLRELFTLKIDVEVTEPILLRINEPKNDIIEVDFFKREEPRSTEESQKLSTEKDEFDVKDPKQLNNRDLHFYKLATKQTINNDLNEPATDGRILFKIVAGQESGASVHRWNNMAGPLPAGAKIISRDGSEVDPSLVGYEELKSISERRIVNMCEQMLYGGVSFL